MSLPNIRCVSCACFASLLALGFVAAASADTKLWNTNSGLFADPASWIGGVPGLGDVAWFDHNFGGGTPPYRVTFRGLPMFQGTANYVSGMLQIGPDTVNFIPSFDPSRGPATYTLNSSRLVGDSSVSGVLNTTAKQQALARVRLNTPPFLNRQRPSCLSRGCWYYLLFDVLSQQRVLFFGRAVLQGVLTPAASPTTRTFDGTLLVHGKLISVHGGPTQTHSLLSGSPAIDVGDPAAIAGTANVPLNDQRGAPYTRVFDGDGVGGARIDIGAFELQPTVPVKLGDYNRNGIVDGADYVVWRKMLDTNVDPFTGADGDGDGVVGQGDYNVWRAHFGDSVPLGAGSTALSASVEPPLQTAAANEEQGTVGGAMGANGFSFVDPENWIRGSGNAGAENGSLARSNLRSTARIRPSPRLSSDVLAAWLEDSSSGKRPIDDHLCVLRQADSSANAEAEAALATLDAVFASLSLEPRGMR